MYYFRCNQFISPTSVNSKKMTDDTWICIQRQVEFEGSLANMYWLFGWGTDNLCITEAKMFD